MYLENDPHSVKVGYTETTQTQGHKSKEVING